MREIKFRAWDKKCNGWVKEILNSEYSENDEDGPYYINERYVKDGCYQSSFDTYGDRLIYMQYTGLKDKNGVEIYEGDIVRNNKTKNLGYIIYSSKNASFEIEMINENRFHYKISWIDELEVIGNIYENEK